MVPAASTIPAEHLHLLLGQAPVPLLYHHTEAISPNTHSTISLTSLTRAATMTPQNREGCRLPLTLKGCCPIPSQEPEPEPTPHGTVCTHFMSPVFISDSEQDTVPAAILQMGN